MFNPGDKVLVRATRGVGWNNGGAMDKYCGTIVTISGFDGRYYKIVEDDGF